MNNTASCSVLISHQRRRVLRILSSFYLMLWGFNYSKSTRVHKRVASLVLAPACGLRPFLYAYLRPACGLRFLYIFIRAARGPGSSAPVGPGYSQFSLTCNRGILQSQSATSKPHALTSSRRFRSITNTCSRNDSSGSRFTRDFRSAQVNECCIIFPLALG